MRWMDGLTETMDMSLGRLQEMERDREAWRAVVHGVAKSRTRVGDSATTPPMASNLQLPVAPPKCDNKNRLQTLPDVCWGAK